MDGFRNTHIAEEKLVVMYRRLSCPLKICMFFFCDMDS